ncbi:hypothetical protein conserved [Leishmania donovani]|uniref:Uncharacterized protein n=3 Tax=Leishmania donovani species complex TaxID=38574 RepID=A4HSX6_LEIIN|nr:conserved hypothetical protein [Leishmania infantum JPCM5]CAC9446457.1 hypothetical_protein_-_conserved [Leishmania infantum]CAJ1986184.1 hypothetical protein conserved [Leishmania donovani]CAM65518.1 conserved hypothetical protein [Leishmania infantum JPCM5]SUZ39132.1 hypothetical_protein_-_conserved [Leishmania infantum]VDZ42084.1 hypothetical_protein_conserved [Leishmania donovani]|eukprot:XP_001463167.1 conserved hypothetical protein [Leishmania infantum JPCM5]
MDVDSEVEPLLREMSKRLAVVRADLLPALRRLDEDTLLSHYSVDEQARLYLSAAFTLTLSLYSLDKITHRQVASGGGAAASAMAASTSLSSASTDTQLALKIERITEYIKKLQELVKLERQRRSAATAAASAADAPAGIVAATTPGAKRSRKGASADTASTAAIAAEQPAKKARNENGASVATVPSRDEEDAFGDAQMFSVVSRVAGETGTLVSRLVKQAMPSSALAASKAE